MKNMCRRFLSGVLAAILMLTLIPGVSIKAAEPSEQEYALAITNDCAGAVAYEVKIGEESQEITLSAGETKEFLAPSGTTYTVTWKEGTEKKYNYTIPEQTVYTGTIGETTEIYYVDKNGKEYTKDQISNFVSYGDYSMQTEQYALESLVTFVRTKSGLRYYYTNMNDESEYYSAYNAEGARDNIKKKYKESDGWSMAVADEDGSGHTECWVFKTVTEAQRVIEGDSSLTIHTNAELVVKPEVTGDFTVATLNVDGMPQTLSFAGRGVYDLNPDGPGSDGSTKIGQYIQNSGYDLIATSENFNYSQQIMTAASNYKCGTIRDSIPEQISLEDIWNLLTGNLFPIDTDGLSLLSKKEIPVTGENCVPWNENYYTDETIFGDITVPSGNGADGMIKKGYRFYQVEIAENVIIDVYILHADADSQEGDIAARTSQFKQLAAAIQANHNGNPIIVMGDTNCRYTRDTLKEDFVEATGMTDAWVELIRDGEYPEFGTPPLVAPDKVGEGETSVPYPKCEVVDKIFYLNNPDNRVQLKALEYNIDTTYYVDEEGALGDHWPVSVKFQYTIKGDECPGHEYKLVETVNPTFETDGKEVYECEICGARNEQAIPKLIASSQPDEYMAVKGEEISLPVFDNDQVCEDPLVTNKEILITDSEGNQAENTNITIQDDKLMFTPDACGQQNVYYALRYTLQDGTQYTTEPAEVKLWVYEMSDKTYILSDGGEQVYSDVLNGDVLELEGMDSKYEISIQNQTDRYGTAVLDNGILKYTPKKYADGVEQITIQAEVKNQDNNLSICMQKQITIVPDTVVYYDDQFGDNVSSEGSDSSGESQEGYGIYFGENWITSDGSNDHSFTITSTSTIGAAAEFTFTGTGLDIMSRISGDPTTVAVQIWKANDEKNYTIENREQIKLVNITSDNENTLYQVPILHFDLGVRDTYYVKIMLSPNFTSEDKLTCGTLYLDGIRIYGALSTEDEETYYGTEKTEMKMSGIRNMIENGQLVFVNAEQINNIVNANSIIGTDEKGNKYTDSSLLEQYITYGPNHEVYLQNNNGLAFYVTLNKDVAPEDAVLQIQARMPEGNAVTGAVNYASSSTHSNSFTVTGTTARLYTIDLTKCVNKGDGTYLVVLNTGGSNILSIESIQYRGLTIHTDLNSQMLMASETGPYIRMLSGLEEKAVLNVTVKSLFGRKLGTVTIESDSTGMPGESYRFSGRDVYKAIRKKGYHILNLLVNLKNYEVKYGETKDITVR